MKVTITVFNKYNQTSPLILFGARYNYLKANYGNNSAIEFNKLEADEEYKNTIGDFPDDSYGNMSAFIMDCIKHNLRITSINGRPLKKNLKVNGVTFEVTQEEKEIDELDPYSEQYETLAFGGENKFEIEFKGSSSLSRKKMILL